jgi:hypothetical protein
MGMFDPMGGTLTGSPLSREDDFFHPHAVLPRCSRS